VQKDAQRAREGSCQQPSGKCDETSFLDATFLHDIFLHDIFLRDPFVPIFQRVLICHGLAKSILHMLTSEIKYLLSSSVRSAPIAIPLTQSNGVLAIVFE
jgi:hypothetical protein